MNSLTLGFFYLVGLTWGLCEVCIIASNGNWTPLTLFLIGFTLVFAIVGCWPMTDKSVNLFGSVFAIILGVALVMIAFSGFFGVEGGLPLGAVVKTILAFIFLGWGVLSLVTCKTSESSHSH